MDDVGTILSAIETAWSAMYPEQIYEYQFLDQQTAEFYEAEQSVLKLIQVFSAIALFIACMGLYGLVSYMAVQKTKEIGIRKVLGGSVANILWIFGKEFFLLILVAFSFASPIGWWIMTKWLQNFEYSFTMTGGSLYWKRLLYRWSLFAVGIVQPKLQDESANALRTDDLKLV